MAGGGRLDLAEVKRTGGGGLGKRITSGRRVHGLLLDWRGTEGSGEARVGLLGDLGGTSTTGFVMLAITEERSKNDALGGGGLLSAASRAATF